MCNHPVKRLFLVGLSAFLGFTLLLFALLHTFTVANAASKVPAVGGVIAIDTTWSAANSPYTVTSDLLIDTNVKLTIEAGVEVRFGSNVSLLVAGTLLAQGSADQMITFTSAAPNPQPGDWRGVRVFNLRDATLQQDRSDDDFSASMLEYVVFQYAGALSSSDVLYVVDGIARVDHSIFRYNSGSGIRTSAAGAQITHNQLYKNTIPSYNSGSLNAVMIYSTGDNAIISGNQIIQNEFDLTPTAFRGGGGIWSCGNGALITKNKISENHTNLPDRFEALAVSGIGLALRENKILDNDGNGLSIHDFLNCSANNTHSSASDSFSDSHPEIISNEIANNEIINNSEYGIDLERTNVDLRSNRVISNGNTGIRLFMVTGAFTLNRVEKNQQGGIYVQYSPPQITSNAITDNRGYNLNYVPEDNSQHLDAKNNWWGSTDRDVINSMIYDGNADPMSSIVDFEPFLLADIKNTEPVMGSVIDTDTTWHVANSPYTVTTDLQIDAGIKLTIEGGVEVRFESNRALLVVGTLLAQGSVSQPITFTSAQMTPQAGDWRGIRIFNPVEVAQSDKNGNITNETLLQHVVLQYAGIPLTATESAIYIVDGAARVEHSVFRYNNGSGIKTNVVGVQITDNQFYSNTIPNIRNDVSLAGTMILSLGDNAIISGNQIMQNKFDFVPGQSHGIEGAIINCGNGGVVSRNTIAQNKASLPFYFVGIGVNGAGSAATENIILDNVGSGLRVGQIGECSNYLSAASASANVIQGNAGTGIYAIFAANNDQVAIVNNQISNNGGDGVSLSGRGNYELNSNQVISNGGTGIKLLNVTGKLMLNLIKGNQQGGVWIEAAFPQIVSNNIIGNFEYSLKNNNPLDKKHLDAKNNWWGSTDRDAIASSIIDWNDNPTLNITDFEPFLQADTTTPSTTTLQTLFLPLVSKNN